MRPLIKGRRLSQKEEGAKQSIFKGQTSMMLSKIAIDLLDLDLFGILQNNSYESLIIRGIEDG